jgi:RND family efflux transporter MFP subunit
MNIKYFLPANLFIIALTWSFWLSAQNGPPVTPVVTASVQRMAIPRSVQLPGVLEPRRRSKLSAGHEGHLLKLLVREGDKVIEGQELARLDTRELNQQVAAAKADYNLLEVRHQESLTQLKRAKLLHERERLSDEEFDGAKFISEGLAHEVARAHAHLQELTARLESATLKAPFAGHITNTFKSQNAMPWMWIPRLQ